MAQESALEVVKVGGLAGAVADSDIGHRNARLGGRLEHAHAHGARKHPVGRASLRKKKCAALRLYGVNDARNNLFARLRAFAVNPDGANRLCGPPHKRKPLKFFGGNNRGRPAVVAQKDIEVGGMVAQQQTGFLGEFSDSGDFEVEYPVHRANPDQEQPVRPAWARHRANQGQRERQNRKKPAGCGQAPNRAKRRH